MRKPGSRLFIWYSLSTATQETMDMQTNHQTEETVHFKQIHLCLPAFINPHLEHSLDSKIIVEKQTSSENLPTDMPENSGETDQSIPHLQLAWSPRGQWAPELSRAVIKLNAVCWPGGLQMSDNSSHLCIFCAFARVVMLHKGSMLQHIAKAAGSSVSNPEKLCNSSLTLPY